MCVCVCVCVILIKMITTFIVLQSARCSSWSDETSHSAVSQLLQGAVSSTHRLSYVPYAVPQSYPVTSGRCFTHTPTFLRPTALSPSPTQSLQGIFFIYTFFIFFNRTWLRSKLAYNEVQASARTCGRSAPDSMIQNVG